MKKLLPLFLCAFFLFGCQQEENEINSVETVTEQPAEVAVDQVDIETEAAKETNTNTQNMVTEKEVTELKIETLTEGKGAAAKKGDNLQMHYTGTLLDGTKFDSSVDRGTPFNFTLGEGQVISGWDEGILGMKVGEKRKLTIPYQMAYGEMGYPPAIPAKATLIFDIELIKIVK